MAEQHAPLKEGSLLRCVSCKGALLTPSGREPYRYICPACGGHFALVMQVVPIPPDRPPEIPELPEPDPTHAEQCTRTT